MLIVFGGAFNPPTKAHLEAYYAIKKRCAVSQFIFLPVSSAYTKRELVSQYHRLNMLKLLIEGLDDCDISDLEMHDDQFLGTYQSLVRLSDQYQAHAAFVIGADNLVQMKHWKYATSLLSEFKIIVLNRRQMDLHAMIDNDDFLSQFKSSFILIDDFDLALSSTHFRESFDASLVTKAVYQYILTHRLYIKEDISHVL